MTFFIFSESKSKSALVGNIHEGHHANSKTIGIAEKILNEGMIPAVVIAIQAIANKPDKTFGTSTGFEPMASALALRLR